MHSSCLVSLVVFLPAWIVTAAPNNGICYNTNGVQDGSSLPCDSKAAVSFCCQFGDMCLSNGLCEPSGNQSQYYTPYFTGLCTDYTWNSPSTCLEICNNNKSRGNANFEFSLNPSNGTGVKPCDNGNYCCYDLDDSECCTHSSLLFTLGSGPATIQTTLGSTLTSTTPTASASLSARSSVLLSSTGPALLPSSTSSVSPENSPSSAATVTTPSPNARPSSNNIAVGVGVGIGVPVGLAILAGLAYLVRRRSNISDGRDENPAYLDNKKELDVNQRVVHETSEIAEGRRTVELSGQGLVEL